MKTIALTTLAALALLAPLRAAEPVAPLATAEEIKNIPRLGIIDLVARGKEFEGKLVRLSFGYRGGDLVNGVGMIYEATRKQDIGYVSIIVPEKGIGWYQRMQYGGGNIGDRMPATNKSVIVRVLGQTADPLPQEAAMQRWLRVQALGREVRAGFKGPEFGW